MSGHTPGPWVGFQCEGELVVMQAGEPGDIAKVSREGDLDLIVAAPTMLQALQHVRRFVETKLHSDNTAGFALGIIDHAIAAALPATRDMEASNG